MDLYARKPETIVTSGGVSCLVIGDRATHSLPKTIDQELLSRVLDETCHPTSKAELLELMDEATLELLLELDVLIVGSLDDVRRLVPRRPAQPILGGRLVVGISGAWSAAEMVRPLRDLRHRWCSEVHAVLTASARKFLNPAALEYCGVTVWTDEFASSPEVRVPHIHLGRLADAILVMPASAHTLHKLAHAECSDLLSLTVSATKAPVIVVPAMNEVMWRNPGVKRNVALLREQGMTIVEPSYGVEVATDDDETAGGGCGVSTTRLPQLVGAVLAARREAASASF